MVLQLELSVHVVRFRSVEQSDDGVDVCPTETRVSQVFQESSFVSGSMPRYRQPERQQKVVGGHKALADGVYFMDQVLQTDDAMFT